MVVIDLLSRIRKNFEIRQLENEVIEAYAKYGQGLLESLEGFLESSRRELGEKYKEFLSTLLRDEVRGYIDYLSKEVNSITSIMYTIHGIKNFVKYVGDKNMLIDYIIVLREYTTIPAPKSSGHYRASEIISTELLHPPNYGTQLRENDPRIPKAVRCTLDELLSIETKQAVKKENIRAIYKIVRDCAKNAGFYIRI